MDVPSIFTLYADFLFVDIVILHAVQKKTDVNIHFSLLDGFRYSPFPHCMQDRWMIFSLTHSCAAFSLKCSTCAIFDLERMFPFIQHENHCTIYSIIPAPTGLIGSLFFCSTEKEVGLGDCGYLRAMKY